MKRALLLLLCALAGTSAAQWTDGSPAECRGSLVYFASLAGAPSGGVAAARFDATSGRLCPLGQVARIEKPTWVLAHPGRPVVYVTSEVADIDGPAVSAFAVDAATGRLRLINRVSSGGRGATHLAIDPSSRTLFVAHWLSGHVSALPIRDDGGLDAPVSVRQGEGSGPTPMQSGPRSHAVVPDPTRRFLLVPDIGADRLYVYRFDWRTRRLDLADPPFEPLPPGSGPRHLASHPNGRFAYLINQLTSEIRLYRWDAKRGRVRLVQAVSTRMPGPGRNDAAEVGVSPDGRFLHATNRGEDSIVIYTIDPMTGWLREEQRMPSGGRTPRAFAIDRTGGWMLVTNQDGDSVAVFRRDRRTGRLSATPERMTSPLPAGIAFIEG